MNRRNCATCSGCKVIIKTPDQTEDPVGFYPLYDDDKSVLGTCTAGHISEFIFFWNNRQTVRPEGIEVQNYINNVSPKLDRHQYRNFPCYVEDPSKGHIRIHEPRPMFAPMQWDGSRVVERQVRFTREGRRELQPLSFDEMQRRVEEIRQARRQSQEEDRTRDVIDLSEGIRSWASMPRTAVGWVEQIRRLTATEGEDPPTEESPITGRHDGIMIVDDLETPFNWDAARKSTVAAFYESIMTRQLIDGQRRLGSIINRRSTWGSMWAESPINNPLPNEIIDAATKQDPKPIFPIGGIITPDQVRELQTDEKPFYSTPDFLALGENIVHAFGGLVIDDLTKQGHQSTANAIEDAVRGFTGLAKAVRGIHNGAMKAREKTHKYSKKKGRGKRR